MARHATPKPVKKKTTRHVAPDGKRCASTAPGAVKYVTTSETYYLRLGGDYVPLGTADLSIAWKRLHEVLAVRHAEDLGITSPATKQAGRAVGDHVAEWLAAVEAGGCEAKRLAMLRTRLARLIDLAGWKRIGDIRRSSLEVALARLRAEPTGHTGRDEDGEARGRSAQTSNHYLGHARQFARWLHAEGRLPADPLAGMKGVSVETDRRHDRRSPSDEEVRVLFDHLHGRLGTPKVRSRMSGERRALGYAVSMSTGLRADELRSLSPASLDLVAGTIRLKARRAKNRRRTLLALPRWLCDSLGSYLAAGGELWEPFPEAWPGRLLKADLAAARSAWLSASASPEERAAREESPVCVYEVPSEDGPLFWDFHALRHWYITQIAGMDGISPSTMQALARHSDPRLTLKIYAKTRQDGVRDAADRVKVPGMEKDSG